MYVNNLLHKVQLHVSAIENGHLQDVHEIRSKQLYYIYYVVYIVGVGSEVGTRSRMSLEVGRCGYMGMLLFYTMSMLIQLSYYVDKYIRSILGIKVLSHEVNRQGRKTNHSPKSSAEHKYDRSCNSAVLHVSTGGPR